MMPNQITTINAIEMAKKIRYALKKLDLLFFSVLLNAHTNIMMILTHGIISKTNVKTHSLTLTGSSSSSPLSA